VSVRTGATLGVSTGPSVVAGGIVSTAGQYFSKASSAAEISTHPIVDPGGYTGHTLQSFVYSIATALMTVAPSEFSPDKVI
jgi:uncharacterized protein YvpB